VSATIAEKSITGCGKVCLVIDHRIFVCEVQLTCKERMRIHPIILSVQDLLRKTLVIDRVKVKGEGESRVVGAQRSELLLRNLLLNFFSLSSNFSP
jgi:hypothetical protein